MKNEVEGRVIEVPQAQTGEGKNGPWRRQTVVVEYEDGRYTQKIALECSNNKAEDFGRIRKGQTGKFYYGVSSREYNGRWYTQANCFDWKLDESQQAAPAPAKDLPF